ncbi:ATPase P [bacterium]|nr:ATPase P [bacterium]
MIRLSIPGSESYQISSVICDMNGTLAVDGVMNKAVMDRLRRLSNTVEVTILTADTFGTADRYESELGVTVKRIRTVPKEEVQAKREVVIQAGAANTVFIGNGANDVEAMETAVFSIGVMGKEGIYRRTLEVADMVVYSGEDALDLLLNPTRLIAGLRR